MVTESQPALYSSWQISIHRRVTVGARKTMGPDALWRRAGVGTSPANGGAAPTSRPGRGRGVVTFSVDIDRHPRSPTLRRTKASARTREDSAAEA